MAGINEGRVVVITGSGRGIGRAHAIEFASQGAKIVVNDLGAEVDGSGRSEGPAGEVVDEPDPDDGGGSAELRAPAHRTALLTGPPPGGRPGRRHLGPGRPPPATP